MLNCAYGGFPVTNRLIISTPPWQKHHAAPDPWRKFRLQSQMEKNHSRSSVMQAAVLEPLQSSALLARQRAPELCLADPVSRQNCAWNHGLWQYLRLLGLITTPWHHASFFREAFGHVATGAATPRVLVSGAADYSMLAHVLAIFGEKNHSPAVTVVDRCDTPLFLNQWYADRLSHSITTRRADILEYRDTSGFDLICSHSFLGQFDPPRRSQLMEKWRNLLQPGGLVATVNRVRPDESVTTVGFSDDQARAFSAAVLRKAETMREIIDVDPRQLADEARIYATRQRAWPVKSQDDIRQLFECAGFQVVQLTCTPVTAGANDTVRGPTTPGSADYACIIARRL